MYGWMERYRDGIQLFSVLVIERNKRISTYRKVDLFLVLLAEEDHASARATQGLVGGGGDNVAVLEGASGLAGGNKTTACERMKRKDHLVRLQ